MDGWVAGLLVVLIDKEKTKLQVLRSLVYEIFVGNSLVVPLA